MIFTITAAGIAAENAALETGHMPVFANLVLGDGTPNPTPFNATAVVHPVFETPILVVERLSSGAIRLHANIPINQEFTIREIGLTLSDGTLYAYMPYSVETGGFFKPTGFDFSFSVILAKQQLPDLNFTYTPVDVQAIANQILDTSRNAIDTHIQSYLIGLTIFVIKLSRDVIELRKETLKV
jgi:hypothetical protein